MNISEIDLENEFKRAISEWSFIPSIERQYHLASMTLFAVGSRETNLTNEVGDNGHGNGVWQLDNRSHTIPSGFNSDVMQQATYAARMLIGLLAEFNSRYDCAFAAYNAGSGTVQYNLERGLSVDSGTAGNDYGADVLSRMHFLQEWQGTSMTQTLTTDDITAISNAITERLFCDIENGNPHRLETYLSRFRNGNYELFPKVTEDK